mgnify:CR=1 FL=1
MDKKDVGGQIDEKRLVSYLEMGISAEDMCNELGVEMTSLQKAVNDVCAKNPQVVRPDWVGNAPDSKG